MPQSIPKYFRYVASRQPVVDFDAFEWKVTITKEAPAPSQASAAAGDDTGNTWDSAAEFSGPAPKPSLPLTGWEKYAQVLLESNEFAFVD